MGSPLADASLRGASFQLDSAGSGAHLTAAGSSGSSVAPQLCPGSDWICGKYLTNRSRDITLALQEHISLTVAAVLIGLVIAFGLALIARRARWVASIILGGATLVYTIPTLAMLAFLISLLGLGQARNTVLIGVTLYSLVILVRAVLTGLQGVPPDVVEAARGMGYGSARLLFHVELPLALPAIMAGLRVATVSTVALITLGSVVDHGGLGNLLSESFTQDWRFEALTASVLCVALAVLADLLLVGLQWLVTPWRHRGRKVSRVPAGTADATVAAS